MEQEFQTGDTVCLTSRRDRVGQVVASQAMAGGYWYTVDFGQGASTYEEASLIRWEPASDVRSLLLSGSFGGHTDFSRNLTYHKLSSPLTDHLYSVASSRTRFLNWQFKPVLKFLDSERHRLLVADEVGLGKTIEAGFILKEMQARQPVATALIVCPAALRTKWQTELKSKFDEDFDILDAARMRRFLRHAEENPTTLRLKAIASIQMLRGRDILDSLEAIGPALDLCVIDEAHYMRNSGTLQHRLGQVLSRNSSALVMLTATPVHLGSSDLFNLLAVLNPEDFADRKLFSAMMRGNRHVVRAQSMLQSTPCVPADVTEELRQVEGSDFATMFTANPYYPEALRKLGTCDPNSKSHLVDVQRAMEQLNLLSHALTRTRKVNVWRGKAQRSPQTVHVALTEDELGFYNAVIRWCKEVWDIRAPGLNESVKDFLTMMVQRQTASCIPVAVSRYLPDSDAVPDVDDLEGFEYVELAFERPSVSWQEVKDRGLAVIAHKYRHLVKGDTKLNGLLTAFRELDRDEPGQKVIVFSFFKPTLNYLEQRLTDEGYPCAKITGDVRSDPLNPDRDDRAREIARFRDDTGVRILLSSAVGSEGIDLQFCHNLVNYDLPWNPMVVEQRIGRLDRIGQKADRISIVNFAIADTIEERILSRLYDRIDIFRESVGDLEGILGQQMRQLRRDLLRRELTPEQQEQRIDQTAVAIEHERRNVAQLEEDGRQLIGTDQFFLDEIERIRRGKRYVDGDELLAFVSEFLRGAMPRVRLVETDRPEVWQLEWADELGQFLRKHLGTAHVALGQFVVAASGRRPLRITFDGEVAFADPSVHFIHGGHPLVKAILAEHKFNEGQIHPIAALHVRSDAADAGPYVFMLYRIAAEAARPTVSTEVLMASLNTGSLLDEETTAEVFAAMSARPRPLPGDPAADQGDIQRALASIEAGFGHRLAERREEVTRSNAALVERQVQSLTATQQRVRDELGDRLASREEADERYVRMIEGQLRNKEEYYRGRLAELEAKREVNLSFEAFGAGIVWVN